MVAPQRWATRFTSSAGVPTIAIVYIAIAIFGHFFMTRMRPGWHITAIGGSRRSAYNSGIPVRRTIALCYVACGRLDGFWEFKLKPWDVAAGTLVVSEAGGQVSRCTGAVFDVHDDQILATNGKIHPELVSLLSARLASSG